MITVGLFNGDVTAAIERITITGGRAPVGTPGANGGSGGGILNRGDLTVTESVITDNATGSGGDAACMNCSAGSAGGGGGIQNLGWFSPMPFQRHGTLTLRDSTIRANFTGDGGDSEGPGGFAGAGGEGGGLETLVPLIAVNSTIVGNHTGISGTAANVGANSEGGGVLTPASAPSPTSQSPTTRPASREPAAESGR